MIFNSLAFAIFLPIVLLLYYVVGKRYQNWVLLLAGYTFYGVWDIRFLYLVSLSTVLDFCTGLMIANGQLTMAQRWAATAHILGFAVCFLVPDWHAVTFQGLMLENIDWSPLLHPTSFGLKVLAITAMGVTAAHIAYPYCLKYMTESTKRIFFLRCSLFGQLGMLGIFKYYNFFVAEAELVAKNLGFDVPTLHLEIILPIGISFYTFQTLSYVCDVYWGKMQPVVRLRDFALFVSYFPPLVAGPIERASHLIPRILGERRVSFDTVMQGAYLILLGLVKKMAIADGLAASVSSIYNSSGAVGWLDIVTATLAFAVQIYCDFSGYSDIACGVSLWFGIELLKNFDQPYFSLNPSEFWRRWHISLSSWLRDYLYIPLGGNRGTELNTYRNLMLTMVLGGLWHGAAWNFLLWGAYQGAMLIMHRLFVGPKPKEFSGSMLQRLPRMAVFFVFVCYGWLLFRATSFEQIDTFTHILLTDFSDMSLHLKFPPFSALLGVLLLTVIEVYQFKFKQIHFYASYPGYIHGAVYALLITVFIMGLSNDSQQFIYFQF
ncbi:MBOAT family O-acyltransferase [Methylomonas sp. AM2-LC]|uniref:MBOAT family O-acyltransferase n=1 Tax=Methylomonas sp. AM2-LC TaxID=3153301 RepID=UPI00326732D6